MIRTRELYPGSVTVEHSVHVGSGSRVNHAYAYSTCIDNFRDQWRLNARLYNGLAGEKACPMCLDSLIVCACQCMLALFVYLVCDLIIDDLLVF